VKFRTSKIAVVGRLVAGLSRLGRQQAGVPEPAVIGKNLFTVWVVMVCAVVLVANERPGTETPAGEAPSAPGTSTPIPGQAAAPEASKTKKKKKKGKS